MSERVGPVFAKCDHAGFVRRTIAMVLDAIMLISLWYGAAYGWYHLAPPAWVTRRSYDFIDAGWLIIAAFYVFGMRLTERGTFGYRLVGIRYAYMLGERAPWSARAFRATLAPVLMMLFSLDHLWILVDKRKQAWHDKMSGFYVVKRHARPIGECRMVQRVVAFMALTLFVWEPAADTPDHAKTQPSEIAK